VFYTTSSTCEQLGIPVKGARVVVQGFGNAGSVAAHLLDSNQAHVIAASDSRGCVYNHHGLDVPKLMMHKERTGTVAGFPGSEPLTSTDLLALECEILVPAALENAITEENAYQVKAKVVAEAANGPVTPEADQIFDEKGIFLIPDILCNAGGVTVSYFEWVQDEQHLFWEAQDVYNRLERVMKTAFQEVFKIHQDRGINMRLAANVLGVSRVAEATMIRGLYP